MRALLKQSGLDEFLSKAQQRNPDFTVTPETLLPYLATVNGSGVNTTVKCVADGPQSGLIEFTYDRADPARLFNKFNVVTKKPTVYITGAPGDSVALSTITAALNQRLGTQVQIGGTWPDFAEQSIVMPAKDSKLDTTLTVPTGTGRGDTSLRLIPGAVLNVELYNRGLNIGDGIPVRQLNPYLRTDNALNHVYPEAGQTLPMQLVCYALDFTEIFGTLAVTSSCLNRQGVGPYSYGFIDATRLAINAILNNAGLPGIRSDYRWSYTTQNATSAFTLGACNTKLTADRVDTLGVINQSFDNSVKVPAIAFESIPGVYNTDVYLNWQSLK
jgi:hypothetical protein